MNDGIHRSQWRMPIALHEQIEKAAKENGRTSANAELVARLKASFEAPVEGLTEDRVRQIVSEQLQSALAPIYEALNIKL